MNIQTRSALLLAAGGLLLSLPAKAEPTFARQFKAEFGYQPSCNACHKDGGGSPVNGYGKQFKQAGSGRDGFAAIAALDAGEESVQDRMTGADSKRQKLRTHR